MYRSNIHAWFNFVTDYHEWWLLGGNLNQTHTIYLYHNIITALIWNAVCRNNNTLSCGGFLVCHVVWRCAPHIVCGILLLLSFVFFSLSRWIVKELRNKNICDGDKESQAIFASDSRTSMGGWGFVIAGKACEWNMFIQFAMCNTTVTAQFEIVFRLVCHFSFCVLLRLLYL